MSEAEATLARMLTDTDMKIRDFERGWSGGIGAKEAAIRATFGWSAARYYQRLDRVLEDRDALRADPILVHRLIRLRDELAKKRARRQFKRAS